MVGALLLSSASSLASASANDDDSPARVELVLFYGEGCPYCAKERAFLVGLQERQPLLDVIAYEVWHDEENRRLFQQTAAAFGVDARSVPTTFLGETVWIGFDSSVQQQIEEAVAALIAGRAPEVPDRTAVDVPFVGTVDLGDSSLIVATLVIGFVDGVNPCSLWVLSVLLALVLHSGSRTRIVIVGLVFLAVTSALYGLYMVGAYSALDYAGEVSWIRFVVALVAGTFGALHLKEYFTHTGVSLTIADQRKPGLYRQMRALARPERSLPAVLAGTVVLAAGVSLAETPCTAGLPLLWTNLLSARDVTTSGAIVLFALYLAVFLLDELIVFGIAVVTLRATKLQERHGQLLQLASGVLMVSLAVTMLFVPELLETVSGTLLVFGAAAGLVGVVLLGDHMVRARRVAH